MAVGDAFGVPHGTVFDIGVTTRDAISRLRSGVDPVLAELIIFLYIISESSADKQHTKADQIYRIGYHVLQPGVLQTALSSGPVGPAMTADYPEILDYVRMMNPAEFKGDFLLSHGDKSAYESGLVFTDTNFFDFFDYEFVHGNKTTALANPNDIVITYEKAIFFFGQSNPLGKVIRIDGEHPMVVSAVVRQPDSPTHLRFHYLIPLQAMNGYLASAFGPFTSLRSINYQTYLLVDKNFDPEYFKKRNAEEYVLCTILVNQQFNYMQQKDLGYATEHRVIVSLPQAERITPQWISGFREELLQHTHVAGVSTALRNPLPGNMIETWMFPIEKSYGTEETVLRIAFVDPDFIDLYNISVIEGRNFSWDHPSDIQGGVLLNESAVRDFGWENPIGKTPLG